MYPSAHCEIGRPGGNGMRAAGSEATSVVGGLITSHFAGTRGLPSKSYWFSISNVKPYDTQRVKSVSVASHHIQ